MSAKESPSLPHVLNEAIRGALLNLHTSMPGIVQSYDATTQRAEVQPVCQRLYEGKDSAMNLPLLPSVPILMPRTKLAWVNLPIQPGDYVLLIFSERSLEQWRLKGGVVDPEDSRIHDLSDAIGIPGVFPETQPFLGNADNLELVNALGKITIAPDGKITLGNEVINLLDLFDQLIDALTTAITNTAIGPQPLVQPLFATIKAQLALIKG